jgi:hypothetical protein
MTIQNQLDTDKNAAARKQALAQLASIKEMVAALLCDYDRLEELKDEKESLQWDYDNAEEGEEKTTAAQALLVWRAEEGGELADLIEEAGECKDADDARQRIEEDPLSIQVRGDWHDIGEKSEDVEFNILLCTGGPACRIVGEWGNFNEPDRARIEFQDWFTPWEELITTGDDNEALLEYCRTFYFGE